jgi:hypothetical protein
MTALPPTSADWVAGSGPSRAYGRAARCGPLTRMLCPNSWDESRRSVRRSCRGSCGPSRCSSTEAQRVGKLDDIEIAACWASTQIAPEIIPPQQCCGASVVTSWSRRCREVGMSSPSSEARGHPLAASQRAALPVARPLLSGARISKMARGHPSSTWTPLRHISPVVTDGEVLSMRSRAGEGLRWSGAFRYDKGDQGAEIPAIRCGWRLNRLEKRHEH